MHADGSVSFDWTPEQRELAGLQIEAASDGLVEVDGVLERCNQLDRLIVRP